MQISTAYLFDRASAQMSNATNTLSKSQAQIATGKQVLNASDAPDQAAAIARLQATIGRQESYNKALDTLQGRLDLESTTLSSASDVLVRIKELTVQANNGTQGTISRTAIATEIKGLRDQLFSLANTRDTTGNYIFSGSKVATPAFQANAQGAVSYSGDQTRMNIAIGDQRALPLNRPGSDAFVRVVRADQQGNASGVGFFQSLDDLITSMNSNDKAGMQRGLTEVDTLHNGVVLAQGDAGTSMKVIEQQGTILGDTNITLKSALSKAQDLDMTTAITDMQKQMTALEAAQASFAKISQLSLFTYLR
jgi:flagellar hook-associated protein 3 FlgL